jgi:hypothetical protein
MDIQSVVEELRREVRSIEAAITALVGLGQTAPRRGRPPKSAQATTGTPKAKGRRRMSAAARAKIAAAQRARWAKQKGQSPAKQTKSVAKKASGRKGMSPAARKRLSEMMKARWAARNKRQSK